MIAKPNLNANTDAKHSSSDSSKETEGTSPEEGSGEYNQGVPGMVGVSQR